MSDNVSLGESSGYDCGHQSEHCGKTCYVWGLLQFSLENCVWLPVHTTFDAVLLQFCVVQGLVAATSTFIKYYAMHNDGALLFARLSPCDQAFCLCCLTFCFSFVSTPLQITYKTPSVQNDLSLSPT